MFAEYTQHLWIVAQILLIAGALNWGLVAANGFDLVQYLVGEGTLDMLIKFAVALSGVFGIYKLYLHFTQEKVDAPTM